MLKIKFVLPLVVLFTVVAIPYFLKKQNDKPTQLEQAEEQVQTLVKRTQLQNGDLIFHTSRSAQSKAIQLATKSAYSHCGIIYRDKGEYFVFEAVQPVSTTPLAKWIARGEGGHYVVKRLKNADQVITPAVLSRMKQEGETFAGKDYDLTFEWSDEKIYCSELIWKIYQRTTGLEIGQLQELKDFDLTAPAVRQKMQERYGHQIPLQEKVISPASMFASDLLITVVEK